MTLVSRNGHEVSLHCPPPRAALERRLELTNPYRQVWFVEDAIAARIARHFINEMGVQRDIDVFIAGNNDAVLALATTSKPFDDSHVSFIGLLDGDERVRRPDLPRNVGFLLSDTSPDSFLLVNFRAAPRSEMAVFLGVEAAALELALASCAGLEHHQALHTLRQELGINLDQLVAGGLRWWVENKKDDALSFIEYLNELSGIA